MALTFLEPVVEVVKPRGRRPLPIRQAGIDRVMDMVAFRDHMRGVPTAEVLEEAARLERRQETKTKLTAFVIFWIGAAVLVFTLWAGVRGGG